MSEENKRIVRRWLLEMWSEDAGLAVADEIIAPHNRVYDPGTPDREGVPDGEKQTVKTYRTIFRRLDVTSAAHSPFTIHHLPPRHQHRPHHRRQDRRALAQLGRPRPVPGPGPQPLEQGW
jgi:hypothetical protein